MTPPRSIRNTRLNDVVLMKQGFYFFVKFGLVLIFIPPRSIRKPRLNDIILVMQGFYFFVKFGLVLIYMSKL